MARFYTIHHLLYLFIFLCLAACHGGAERALYVTNFTCENDMNIRFEVTPEHTQNAQLFIDEKKVIDLYQIRSASGARYGSEQGLEPESGLIIWNKGKEVTLYEMILDDSITAADYPIITKCTARN